MKGYFVAVKKPIKWLRQDYRGLYRGPGWNDAPDYGEEEAVDAYIWGPYCDDENEGGLIPTEESARDLLRLFATSRREFEIIYAQTPDEAPSNSRRRLLGFDIACETPFWSIVADWHPNESLQPFLERLNEHGLFGKAEDAEEFLMAFRAAHPEEDNVLLHVWRIEAVTSVD